MAQRVLVVLAVLLASLAVAGPARAAGLQVGIASDGLMFHGGPVADQAVVEWKRLGIDVVRLQIAWSRVAPTPDAYSPPFGFSGSNPDDPGYRWQDVDAAVDRVVRAGMRPMLMVSGPPPLWASSKPLAGNRRYQPAAWHYGAFAAAVARRYGQFVKEYILINEPNLPLWLQPQAKCVKKRCTPVSPHVYRYMARAAYPAIHAADPDSAVLVGALAPRGHNPRSRNADMRPLQWLRAFGCVNRRLRPIRSPPCDKFEPAIADGFAYHPHSTKAPPDEEGYEHRDDASLASLSRLQRVLDSLQRQRRLIGTTTPLNLYLDEYAYQTNPPDKERGVTPGRQDRFLQHAAYDAWRNPRVKLLTQYLWYDEPVGGGRRYTGWQSGLLWPDGSAKPALAHFDDPFWIDFELGRLWGQVRPGGAHDVDVQVRPPGAGTGWQTIARVRTALDGGWLLRTKLVPYAAYRAVADNGEAGATMIATPPGARHGPGEPDAMVERRVAGTAAGAAVPTSFAGFSMEYRSVPDYIGANGIVNPLFARLVRTLGRAGNGAPTLRFGGDSADRTWWNPDGVPRPPGIVGDVTPAWLQHLALWRSQTGTPLVLGLNLALNDPANAAAFAHAAGTTLPAGSIVAGEIGNEPDLYSTPRTYRVGRNVLVRDQRRDAGYDQTRYFSELDQFVATVGAAAPGLPLSAGGFAASSWDDHAYDLFSQQPRVRNYSTHSYALQACSRAIRRGGGTRRIPKLLGRTAFSGPVARARPLVAVATSQGAIVRMTEMNSATCGGLPGLSDTMTSALWGLDVLFGLAETGVRNVDFHTWTGSVYGPVEFAQRNGRLAAKVRPLFYAMLLFNRAAPPGSRLLSVGPNPPGGRIKTWATIDRAGTRRIVVINKDARRSRTVLLSVPGAGRTATVQRLMAPSLKSKSNVRLGGRGYGEWTEDARLVGKREIGRRRAKSGWFTVEMRRGSAALVTVPRP